MDFPRTILRQHCTKMIQSVFTCAHRYFYWPW